ncbi:MAG: hypothetical protein LC644_10790, partial [Pseudonocardia sp.]|nr:hypothetical protein [Pseudonocardia sp.]
MQRRTSNSGGIMVVGQKIALCRQHARQVVTVHVSATALTVELDGAITCTCPRTTTKPVRSLKAQTTYAQKFPCFLGHVSTIS